jgi:poly-gamma-glutamate capsule biosynthesis protein CapA/YwtB (metallophosphatase superfamily)
MATEPEASERDARGGPPTPAGRRPGGPEEPGGAGPPWNLSDELWGLETTPEHVDVYARADPGTPARGRARTGPGVAAPTSDTPRAGAYAAPPLYSPQRIAAVLTLGLAALAVLLQVASVLSSGGSRASFSGLSAEPSLAAVAPGGKVALEGAGAPADTEVLLETRARDGSWRPAGETQSDDKGAFRVEARVVAHPGELELRARVAAGGGVTAPVPVTVRTLRLASVGDVNLGDVPGAAIEANGPRYPWESVGAALKQADIAFGNLECAISERGTAFPKQFNFRGTPEALAGLRRHSGIDVLNLANNHVGDFGPAAMLDTIRTVRRLGVRAVGAGHDLRGALRPQVVERLGLKVAFVGFSNILPLEFAAEKDRPGIAWATPESVTAAVQAARRRADVVVATFHWGIEKATYETADQQELAQVAADAGAHLVIGAHPHVLQPLRRAGHALVAYSLGNFVFGAQSSDTAATGILETRLTAEGVRAARWRAGQIVGGRPVLDDARPQRLPVRDPAAMTAGLTLSG